jgi:uncharacterized iron-regulated membrane protein
MSRRLYALHRWFAAFAFLQFAVWTTTGLFFALTPEERVGGAPVKHAHEAPLGTAAGAVTPAAAVACFAAMGITDPHRLELRSSPAGLFYVARTPDRVARIDARSCAAAPVERAEAEATARRDQPGEPAVREAVLIEKAPVEYRTKPVPAWRVELADADATAVYVDARTGDVTARRNGTWRTFDFFYGLHIMQYQTREGLNNPLLVAAASLAAFTVLSGIVLWGMRLARWLRKPREPSPRPAPAPPAAGEGSN